MIVATADCNLAALDARSGSFLAGRDAWVRPKNADSLLCVAPVGADGTFVTSSNAPVHLPWAENNSSAPERVKGALQPACYRFVVSSLASNI